MVTFYVVGITLAGELRARRIGRLFFSGNSFSPVGADFPITWCIKEGPRAQADVDPRKYCDLPRRERYAARESRENNETLSHGGALLSRGFKVITKATGKYKIPCVIRVEERGEIRIMPLPYSILWHCIALYRIAYYHLKLHLKQPDLFYKKIGRF